MHNEWFLLLFGGSFVTVYSLTLSVNALHTIILTCAISLYVLWTDNILLGRCVGISADNYSIEQQEGLEMNDISCNLESEELVQKTYLFWWKWTSRHGSINSKFHDQIGYVLLSDSGKCVCVAKSNFLLNMNRCSGQREICSGMSGHQSNTKFLTGLITFWYGSGTEVWKGLIILHGSSQSTCSTRNKCLNKKQVCLIQNHKTKICSLLMNTT